MLMTARMLACGSRARGALVSLCASLALAHTDCELALAESSTHAQEREAGGAAPGEPFPSPQRQAPPVGNQSTAKWRVFTDMSRDFVKQGKLDDAERYLRRALEEARTGFSAGDPHVAAALNNLAELYRLRHEYGKAVPLFHEARTLLEQAYGHSHPSVATTLHNLGGMYTQQGDYPAAMAAYADALRCKEASLGRLHPEYAATLAHLAEVTALHGRPGDAAALLQESLEVMEAIGAGYSRLAQRRMTRLAHLLSASRQHPQAAAVHRKLVQAADMAPSGPEDGGAAMWAVHARVGLADALAAIPSSVPEAQQLYSQCLADTRRLCGEAHPLTAACMRRVADIHAREGSPSGLAKAEELLRTVLQVLAAQLEAKADVIPDVNRERLVITQEVAAAHLCLAEVLQKRKAPGSEVAGHVAAASAALDAAPPGYARDALSVRLRAFANA